MKRIGRSRSSWGLARSFPIAIVTAMATQSLYRRYRPRRFSEVKGQDHIVRALRNSVAEGREGQAYLFSGPRGTGKTSSARILAKVLNCESPGAGEPCCECESCLAVERGTSYDVHELDAASNNGVDAMRDLIEKASLGTPGRHKVYILDEVHMLSKAAEAALLKTLEEPPPHVVFVLATTDPQKMSDTIRSRTQHLQFHLLPADTLQEHVRWVVEDAGLDVDDAAVDRVLSQGGGSARDTLSALELVSNAGLEGMEAAALDEFVEAMIDRDPGRALTMVGHAVNLGRDPRTLTEELIGFLRNGFLALMAPEMVQLPSQQVEVLGEQARRLGPPGLVRGIECLGTALTEMRHAPDPRVLLDVATAQLTSDSVAPDLAALLLRLERLERQVAEGTSPTAAAAPASQPGSAVPPASVDPATGRAALGGRARSSGPAVKEKSQDESSRPARQRSAPAAGAVSNDVEPVSEASSTSADQISAGPIQADVWENTIRPSLRGMARAVYAPAAFVSSSDTSLTLSVPNAVHRSKCEQHRSAVESALSELVGSTVALELIDADGGGDGGSQSAPTPAPESAAPKVGQSSEVTEGQPTASVPPGSESPPADVVAVEQPTALQHEDEIDLDDLVDAPPETVKLPIDRLAEAFPGSELVVERN